MIPSRCSPGTFQTTVPANAWVEYDFTTLLNSGDADYTFVLIPQSTDGMDTHSRENTNKPTSIVGAGVAWRVRRVGSVVELDQLGQRDVVREVARPLREAHGCISRSLWEVLPPPGRPPTPRPPRPPTCAAAVTPRVPAARGARSFSAPSTGAIPDTHPISADERAELERRREPGDVAVAGRPHPQGANRFVTRVRPPAEPGQGALTAHVSVGGRRRPSPNVLVTAWCCKCRNSPSKCPRCSANTRHAHSVQI